MKKRILSVLLMAVMIVSLTPLSVYAANTTVPTDSWNDDGNVATAFAGGTGTKDDPYKIETAEQLAKISKDVAAGTYYTGSYFRLENDIDLSAHRWIPIGRYATPTNSFRGFLDGNGKTITGMVVDSCNAGLFGHISSQAGEEVGVKNLTITDATLYANQENDKDHVRAGIFAAAVNVNTGCQGNFENIVVSGTIEANAPEVDTYIGGLIGDDARCTVKNCKTNVTITGAGNAGGMVGFSGGSSFENCTAKGKISGFQALGGFVGYSTSLNDKKNQESTFTKCIADVDIEASDWHTGGFVGLAEYGRFENSAAFGNVTGAVGEEDWGPRAGGFVGGVGNTGASYLANSSADFIKCHSTGIVTNKSKNYKAGGFAGNFVAGTFTDCSYDHEKNANLDAVGEGTTDQKVSACTTQKTLSNICVDVYGGHKYAEEFTVDKQPTCAEDGSKSQHCTRCDEKGEAVVLPATGNHEWESDYTVDKKPTATEDGIKSIHCKNCDAKKDETRIPATGASKSDSSASTGDDARLGLWAALLMLSGCAAAGAVIYRRKQNSAK